jgi:hypothetical protein
MHPKRHYKKFQFSSIFRKKGPHLVHSHPNKNLDFFLNLGYNDHYKPLHNSSIGLWDRFKFFVFKGSYKSIFKKKYNLLLEAVDSMNYDQLEKELEEGLLKRVAADVYQINVAENWDFEILNEKESVGVSLIAYNKLLVPQNEDIPIEEYFLDHLHSNLWEIKHISEGDQEYEEFDQRMRVKLYYTVSPKDVIEGIPIVIPSHYTPLQTLISEKERQKIQNMKFVSKEIGRSIYRYFN